MNHAAPLFSNDKLLEILSLSNNATAIYTTEQVIIQTANDAMISFWGKDRSVIGKRMEEGVPELKGQPFIDIIKNVWLTGVTYEAKNTAATLHVNGTLQIFYFDFVYKAIKNDRGEMDCILHTAIDVTEHNQNREAVQRAMEQERDLIREQALNEELSALNEELSATNEELQRAQHDLKVLNDTLEDKVQSRTKKLTDSQAKLNLAIETGKMGTWSINPNTLEVTMSPFIKELFGCPADTELSIEEIVAAIDPDYRKMVTDALSNAIVNHESSDTEYPITTLVTKERKWVRATGKIFFDASGDAAEYSGMLIDSTSQVTARQNLERIIAEKTILEKDLRENQQRLQSILDTMAEGVCIIDADRNVVYANTMAQRIMGFSEVEIRDDAYTDLKWQNLRVDGSPLPAEERPMAVMMETGKPVYDQEICIKPHGRERFYISVNAAPIFDQDGKLTGGIGTFMDVTNRRKLTQQKDEFISVASHELKTPLTTLMASLQLLDRMKEKPVLPLMAKLITQSNRSLEKLNALVVDLLNVNRITEGQLQLVKTILTIEEIIDESCSHLRTAGTHEITVHGDLQIQVNADQHQINQVIINLINNAVKYAPDAKEITITVERLTETVKISVKDHGPGVSALKIPHLFERYYRADYSGLHFSGLGLGLYICAEIIRKHGGEIGVDSEVGSGSNFWFTLPCAD